MHCGQVRRRRVRGTGIRRRRRALGACVRLRRRRRSRIRGVALVPGLLQRRAQRVALGLQVARLGDRRVGTLARGSRLGARGVALSLQPRALARELGGQRLRVGGAARGRLLGLLGALGAALGQHFGVDDVRPPRGRASARRRAEAVGRHGDVHRGRGRTPAACRRSSAEYA